MDGHGINKTTVQPPTGGNTQLELVKIHSYVDIGCGRTKRVKWVYFSETWSKIIYFMSGCTEMGYMKWVNSIDVMR